MKQHPSIVPTTPGFQEKAEDSYIFKKENKLDSRLLSHYTKLRWINQVLLIYLFIKKRHHKLLFKITYILSFFVTDNNIAVVINFGFQNYYRTIYLIERFLSYILQLYRGNQKEIIWYFLYGSEQTFHQSIPAYIFEKVCCPVSRWRIKHAVFWSLIMTGRKMLK